MKANRPPLGQHFLRDDKVLRRILKHIKPASDDFFVEVGPGTGRLTRPLLEAGASVHAIERDRTLAAKLPAELGKLAARLKLDCADAAKGLPAKLPASWRFAGNIPYAISGPLITLFTRAATPPKDCHMLVQLEFAERLAAASGSRTYGRLSVIAQAHYDVSLLFKVPPNAFSPQPKVDSAVVLLVPSKRRGSIHSSDSFFEVVRMAFSQRRKKLGSTLGRLLEDLADETASRRAEELDVAEFIELGNQLARRVRK